MFELPLKHFSPFYQVIDGLERKRAAEILRTVMWSCNLAMVVARHGGPLYDTIEILTSSADS